MQLRLKLDNLKEAMYKKLACNIKKITARVFMHNYVRSKHCLIDHNSEYGNMRPFYASVISLV